MFGVDGEGRWKASKYAKQGTTKIKMWEDGNPVIFGNKEKRNPRGVPQFSNLLP